MPDTQVTNPQLEDVTEVNKTELTISNNEQNFKTTELATKVSDIIGEYGLYQLLLTILTFLRYVYMALMTNSGPLLAPEVEFWCKPPSNLDHSLIEKPSNLSVHDYLRNRCSFKLLNSSEINCNSWTYNIEKSGNTLTSAFDLVCEQDWLRSAFQSILSFGVVMASIIWGSFSDRHGRNYTIKICFIVSLIGGIISYLTENFFVFAASRSVSTFGDLGLVVSLSTIIVESLGNKYRGTTGVIVYTGWSIGVMLLPWLVDWLLDYRKTILTLCIFHIITLPVLLSVGESVRWLFVNGYSDEACQELHRITKFNSNKHISPQEIKNKIDQLKVKFAIIAQRRMLQRQIDESKMSRCQLMFISALGGFYKIKELLQSKEAVVTTLTLVWTTFNSEFLYMLSILINSDVGDNVKLNYAIGGIMEILATIISIIMILTITRKLSLVSSLLTISVMCFILALTHHIPSTSVLVLNLFKFAISTLSSIVYVVATEIFPTNIRQTGFGIIGTIGSLGAVVAPFIRTELSNLIGLSNVLFIVMILPLTAAIIIPFFLKETKGVDLSDDVEEINQDSWK